MCESLTGWADVIAQLVVQDATVLEGTYALGCWIDNQLSATEYYTISTVDMSSGKHIYMWMNCSGRVDTKANGGYRIVLYTDSSNYATFYVGGNDTHGTGWLLLCCDASASPDLETGTFDPSDVTRIGLAFKTITAAKKQGQAYMYNCFFDAVRYGTGHTITSAETDDAAYEDIFIEEINDNYYGVIQKSYGSYIQTGKIILGGTGTETCDFIIDNEIIVFPDNDKAAADFYEMLPLGNATNPTYVVITGSVLKAAGAQKFALDASGANIDTFTIDGCTFNNAGSCVFQDGQSITSSVFVGCDMVEPESSTFEGNTISESSGVDALLFPTSTNNMAGLIFNSDGAGHAILIENAGTITFDNFKFNGYASGDGSTGNECVYNDSGELVTINIVNGGDTPTIHNGSGASTVVNNAVTLSVTVKTTDGTAIENVRVLIEADTGGAASHEVSVAIVSTGTTATVTHSTHGMVTDDMVIIRGANEQYYNGVFIITYVSAGSYTYTMSGDPNDTATGIIAATQAFMSKLTIAGGIAEQSFNAGGAQPYTGVARKSSSSPYYRDASFSGADCSGGIDIPVQMESDE